MLLSTREVPDLSNRCFLSAGLPKGTAETYARSIWWAEAYRGEGLTTLHRLLEDLPDFDRTALTLRDRAAMGAVIDSDAQPSLVSGPPALDLSSARATRRGIGITYADTSPDDASRPALGHLAYAAAERGLVGVVLSVDGDGASLTVLGTPDEPHPLLAEVELDAPSGTYAEIRTVLDRGLHRPEHSPLIQTFFDDPAENRHPNTDARLFDRLLERATEPARAAPGIDEPGFVLLCIDPRHPLHSGGVGRVVERFVDDERAALTEVFDPERVQERVETLLQEGVEVERSVWEDIFDFSSGFLAPPFEGSEKDAGFDLG